MAQVTPSSIVYLLFTIIIGFIAIPFCVYCIIQFYGFRDDKRFKKRHGQLSTFTACCFVAELFSGCLLTFAFSGFGPIQLIIAFAWIGDILNFISYFLIIHCLVLRFWCLYYDIKYQLSTNTNLWKSLIDKNYTVDQEHLSQVKSFDIEDDLWFIKNKTKEGNVQWVLKTWFLRSFLLILVLLSIMILIEVLFTVGLRRGVIEVIFTLLFFIPWFFMIYIYHKIPQFFDTYFIRKEIVVIHNIDLVDVVASAIVSIIANYGIYTATNASSNISSSLNADSNPYNIVLENDWLNILMITTFYIMGISHIIIIYIMTFWVRNKIIIDEKHMLALRQRASSQDSNATKLNGILSHQYGYELFMEHLSKEFSIENLLSITEFMQYKLMIKNAFNLKDVDNDDSAIISLPMADIPKSSIVYKRNNNDNNNNHNKKRHSLLNVLQHTIQTEKEKNKINDNDNDYKPNKDECGTIIYELYYKYIRRGAELELNVSSDASKGFNKYIDESNRNIYDEMLLNDKKYYTIFDEIIEEILSLMKLDSYARFIETQRYRKFKNAMNQNSPSSSPSSTSFLNM